MSDKPVERENPGFPPFTDLMWLRLGPVLQSGKDAIIALNDPVLFDGQWLQFGCSDGHAETDLQNPTTYKRWKKQLSTT